MAWYYILQNLIIIKFKCKSSIFKTDIFIKIIHSFKLQQWAKSVFFRKCGIFVEQFGINDLIHNLHLQYVPKIVCQKDLSGSCTCKISILNKLEHL